MFVYQSSTFVLIFSVAAMLQGIMAYPKFRDLIPNGHRVPQSCDPTQTWAGVGHENPTGAGPFNSFGRDFNAVGQRWTKELCQMDSDGDGRRNGVELGDPDCVWTPGQSPAISNISLLSHPGVCEPLESVGCQAKNTFLPRTGACAAFVDNSEWCPAISGKDVKKIVLRFDETTVPANDTSYVCQLFELPSDDDYQILAYEPFITNVEIMHHMVSFVCDNPDDLRRLKAMPSDAYKKPVVCGMSPVCKSFSMIWAFGVPSRCYDNNTAIPFGKNYYNKTILQIHYNNPEQRPSYVDSSGVVIYYTKRQRPQNIGSLIVGQMDVRLPPKTPWTVNHAEVLSDNCSSTIMGNTTYKMTSVLFHMHKAGVYGKLMLKKHSTGEVITLLDRNISYDRPAMLIWSGTDAISLKGGDSIYVECGFNTSTRSNWTFFGERTSDEMCLAIIETFPLINRKMSYASLNYGPYDHCALDKPIIDNCSVGDFRNSLNFTKVNKLGSFEAACTCRGVYPVQSCSSDCYSFLNRTGLLTMRTCLSNSYLFKLLAGVYDTTIVDGIASQVQQCANMFEQPPAGSTCMLPSPTGGKVDSNSYMSTKLRRLVGSVVMALQTFLEEAES